ncbi:MAG: DUF1211 domain-containing protein [Methanosphaera stadtmanae]|nr:DUF1211 domain-containing protein [Methanosphaera stadtmanae]
METGRFEALIDAILAIIITIIVMEIPLPETTSIYSLIELYPQFISYTLSFVICFNFWNYHHNLFSIVNKLNSSVTWANAMGIMIVGLLPHVTMMVSTDFYSFIAQFMFGLVLLLTDLTFYITDILLIRIDKANIALRFALRDRKNLTITTTIIQIMGMIIGYFVFPPVIMIGSILALIVNLTWNYIKNSVY